jgi:predicted peptidase
MKKTILLAYVLFFFASSPTFAQDKPAQTSNHLDREIKVRAKIAYLLFLPEGYEKSTDKYPLMLFLHGAGESGSDIAKVKVHGPPKIVETKKDFPFIVVSPQSPGRGWDVNVLNALLDEIVEKYRVDKDRVYLTGLSMGGYGTWALATAFPGRFAAIAPICGGGNPVEAVKLKDVPIWAFHGAKDNVVPLERSKEMVEAVERNGNKEVKLTVYPEATHDSWTETYNNQELYAWLLKHKLSDRKRL